MEKTWLERDENGLVLTDGSMRLMADFSHMLSRMKDANLRRELLVRAAKKPSDIPHPIAIDATAGFGEDAFLLAAVGFTVCLYENDPVIAALLRDALDRASLTEELAEVVSRMTLREEDSISAMRHLEERPHIIYLDPMFPERKKSGLVKKKFQLLHDLERPCADEEALLEAAIEAGPSRVIIKRPLKGPALAGRKPSFSLEGKSIRYDVITLF